MRCPAAEPEVQITFLAEETHPDQHVPDLGSKAPAQPCRNPLASNALLPAFSWNFLEVLITFLAGNKPRSAFS
jgi:hypothetical protein